MSSSRCAVGATFSSSYTLLAAVIRHGAVLLPCLALSQNTLAQDVQQTSLKGSVEALALPSLEVTGQSIPGQISSPSENSGSYKIKRSSTATGLSIDVKDTPQVVSTVTHEVLQDFTATSINDALQLAPGVNVEKLETDRTAYTARGFDIINVQVDGVGVPDAYSLITGDVDTAIYDRIEILKGANGLTSGTGNPSATINLVRKRPTYDTQTVFGVTAGSWGKGRLDLDVSGSLNEEQTIRGRFVAAKERAESYLDRYAKDRLVGYGVLEADVTEQDTVTLGFSQERSNADSPMWGALPLSFTDGSSTHYDVSTSTASDWSYWNTRKNTAFVEWQHNFENDWRLLATAEHTKTVESSNLFYVYGTPDKATGEGLFAYPSAYGSENKKSQLALRLSGPYSMAGREHELIIGAGYTSGKLDEFSGYAAELGMAVPDLSIWDGRFDVQDFYSSTDGGTVKENQTSVYGATRIHLSDDLNIIAGVNHTAVRTKGMSYGASKERDDSDLSPYLGAIYSLNDEWNTYASYTAIFNPQNRLDENKQRLDPISGKAYEVGVKGSLFDDQLLATAAVFYAEQANVAERAGTIDGQAVYAGVDTISKGVEFELSGKPTQRINLSAGLTLLEIEDEAGKAARTFVPKRTLRLSGVYQIPGMESLKVGGSVRWQSDTENARGTYKQDAYTLLDLMASYEFNEEIRLIAKVNNITNQRYVSSLHSSQGFYGAPRNGTLTLSWNF